MAHKLVLTGLAKRKQALRACCSNTYNVFSIHCQMRKITHHFWVALKLQYAPRFFVQNE